MKKRKGERVVRRTLADGTVKEYHYGPRTGAVKTPRAQTVAKALADWQRSTEWRSLRPRTTENYIRYSQPLHDALGQIPLREVKRRHLLEIRDQVAENSGDGAATAVARVAGAFFAWAVDREMVEASPATRLSGGLKKGTLATWSEDQYMQALETFPEHLRRVVMLAAHTGQRRGDLVAMRWDDWDGHAITVSQQKARKQKIVRIPLSAEMNAELARWKADNAYWAEHDEHPMADTILVDARGRSWVAETVTKYFAFEVRRVGLPTNLTIHGLRKLALVRLAMAGCTPHEIMSISGHETIGMVEHYTRGVRQAELAEQAMNRLQKKQKGKKGGKSA